MIGTTADSNEAKMVVPSPSGPVASRTGLVGLLLLSAWSGLVAGLLEVGAFVLRKQTVDPDHLYGVSQHFVWLIPMANLCVFAAMGVFGCVVVLAWPRRGRWLFARSCAR